LIGAIRRLDQRRVKRYLQDLCSIDKEAFGTGAWSEENFERVLPGKFELSRVVFHKTKPVGYLVASRYDRSRAHIHRLAVSFSVRRKRIGVKLCRSLENECLRQGIAEITLESTNDRYEANCFYERVGFRTISGLELKEYVKHKEKTSDAERYSGLSPQGAALVYRKQLVQSSENPSQQGCQESL